MYLVCEIYVYIRVCHKKCTLKYVSYMHCDMCISEGIVLVLCTHRQLC